MISRTLKSLRSPKEQQDDQDQKDQSRVRRWDSIPSSCCEARSVVRRSTTRIKMMISIVPISSSFPYLTEFVDMHCAYCSEPSIIRIQGVGVEG